MIELALWWCGDNALALILRYVLIAFVWLAGMILNKRKKSRILGWLLLLWGLLGLTLAAAPIWLGVCGHVPTGGAHGLAWAIFGLLGFIAGLIYIVLTVWTIALAFPKKRGNDWD